MRDSEQGIYGMRGLRGRLRLQALGFRVLGFRILRVRGLNEFRDPEQVYCFDDLLHV